MSPKQSSSVEDRYGPVILECVSKSDPDREPYKVRCKDGHYSCNCKAWIFAKGDKRCIHTDRAEKFGPNLDGPIELTETANYMQQRPSKPSYTPKERSSASPLLVRLLDCLTFAIRAEITAEMQNGMDRILAEVIIRQPVQSTPMATKVRRIIFDD